MRKPLSSAPKAGSAVSSAESRIVLGLILLTLFLAGLPYLLGYSITPPGMQFVGTAYNIDDYCNYLSWLRQAMDGHFFLRSLFTTDPQKGLEFNVFFWLLGRLAHGLHLSPQAALQVARIGGGLALLVLIYRFYRFVLPKDVSARLTAFGFACLGSGFGWVSWAHWHDKNLPGSPVDAWQPEAFTFLTLYTSALMTVSTLLILGALYALLLGEETGKWRYSVIAGLCGAILGNMHSYDVLHLSAAWGLFLVVWTVMKRGRGVALSWARGALALAMTLPTTVYQYLVFQHETVFRQRANVPTLSPALWHYVLGYGLVFLLALVAVLLIVLSWFIYRAIGTGTFIAAIEATSLSAKIKKEGTEAIDTSLSDASKRKMTFVICWAIAGLAIIYLPVAFQRKMLMGEHIPLCLLAGFGAAFIGGNILPKAWIRKAYWVPLVLIVAASVPSNLLFLARDMNHLEHNRSETLQFPFLSANLVDMFHWIAVNTPPNAAVVGSPPLCAYLPGYADRTVWAGHWAETPRYGEKLKDYSYFSDHETPDAERRQFLIATKAQYLLYPNDVSGGYQTKQHQTRYFVDFTHATPSYLTPVYRNKDYTLFRINLEQ
jgi:hypothetical protein